jgi:hypothetical protein
MSFVKNRGMNFEEIKGPLGQINLLLILQQLKIVSFEIMHKEIISTCTQMYKVVSRYSLRSEITVDSDSYFRSEGVLIMIC